MILSKLLNQWSEYILINYRWVFVCSFLLPVSVCYDLWTYVRNYIVFKLNSAPNAHDSKVAKVQKQVQEWNKSGRTTQMCTARPGWQTMSFRQGKYKKTMFNVHINLVDILDINEKNQTIKLEPLVTMGQVTAFIGPLGWTLPIIPEIDDLTVGGMVMGTGIESSSHIHGLFQHICVSFELVLADGSIVTCSREKNSDLFYAVPWSHGTLGFLTAVELKIKPVSKYVRLEYKAVYNSNAALQEIQKQVDSGVEFVECLMFGLHEGVIMTGEMTDHFEEGKLNEINKWYKPWFFEHVREYLSIKSGVEYIPIRDYYHRHTRSIFWELKDIIPFGNHPLFRYLFGWAVPPKISLLKLTQTAATKKLYETQHMIQDMLVPLKHLPSALELFDRLVKIYPVWVCPFKLTNDPGFVHSKNESEMFVDIGIYGVPEVKDFEPVKTTRMIEEQVRAMNGFQMLYADTYMTEEEFRQMFDHTLYDKMRKELICEAAFTTIYGKVNRSARY